MGNDKNKLLTTIDSFVEMKKVQLKARYSVLSELYNPKSKHATHIRIGRMMDLALSELEIIEDIQK